MDVLNEPEMDTECHCQNLIYLIGMSYIQIDRLVGGGGGGGGGDRWEQQPETIIPLIYYLRGPIIYYSLRFPGIADYQLVRMAWR